MKEPNLPRFDNGIDIKNLGFPGDGGLSQRSHGIMAPAERQRRDPPNHGRRIVSTINELTTHA